MLGFRIVVVGLLLWSPAMAADEVDYVRDVLPILETYCIGCHTADDAQGGLVMESHGALMKGGETGLAVTAGVASSSRLFLMASGKLEPVMPPDDMEGPNEDELEILARWIDQGAVGPTDDGPIRRQLRVPMIATSADATQPITAIAIAPDRRHRAVARFGTVELEIISPDAKTPSRFTLRNQPGKVNALRFDADGSRLLVASGVTGAYGVASMYDLHADSLDEPVQEFVGHRDTLYAAEFSPDGTIVATAGYDRDIVLWDATTGERVRTLSGHNGAIFDVAFSPDGTVLASACADETVKLWNVASGQRLDTLSQSEGEVFAVDFTPDGQFIVAAGADNRLRVYQWASRSSVQTNPLIATRFVDPSRLISFAFIRDPSSFRGPPSVRGPSSESTVSGVAVLSESGAIKILSSKDWQPVAETEPVDEVGSDLMVSADGQSLLVSLMDGRMVERTIPLITTSDSIESTNITPVLMDLGPMTMTKETELESNDVTELLPVTIHGTVSVNEPVDQFTFEARAGEVWAIDADASKGARLDPIITVLDESNQVVVRARLQAVLDSYFTFRGKNSSQANDFRLFAWREMHLNDYLYAGGEVTRLWMHPRGPDSGFNVYPGVGNRFTYFGTTHATHALGEPAFIVRPLAPGQAPVANGLPVFEIPYQNDDDPMRRAGKNSRLLFTTPRDGHFKVAISDTRGESGDGYDYELRIRAAEPSFVPRVAKLDKPLHRGAGRELEVSVDRIDGFDGAVVIDVRDMPESIRSNFPLTIEPGQTFATANVWADDDATTDGWATDAKGVPTASPQLFAQATIGGRVVRRSIGPLGPIRLVDRPDVTLAIEPIDLSTVARNEDGQWKLTIRRGQTISARVVLDRRDGFDKEITLGKEMAGRNAPHGVIVDNIGLSGLLVLKGENEREFFLTADPVTALGTRPIHLMASGGVTSPSVLLEVLP